MTHANDSRAARGSPARESIAGCLVVLGIAIVAPGPGAAQETVAAPAAVNGPIDPLLEEAIGYYTGIAGDVDDARAHQLLLEAAADGDTLSTMWLARCYSRGRMEFDEDRDRARAIAAEIIGEVRRLAELNVAEAAFLMGTAYAVGLGVDADRETALRWYFSAANLGNALAAHNLGNAYREADGRSYDPRIAAYWYRKAAEIGDALPMFWLGQMYENGEGLPVNVQEARRWYREAAERGRADARDALERLGG